MNTVISIIESLFFVGNNLLVPETSLGFDMTSLISVSAISLVIDIVITILIFIISHNIMSKKLNLI